MSPRVMVRWLLAISALALSQSALARDPTAEDRTTARELAVEGYDALKARNYATAADRFKRADDLVHAPTLLVDLGRSYLGLGWLVRAHEAFQQVLREGVAKEAPASWQRALVAAREEDAKVEPRLAWVTIRVEGAENPQLKLDDEELPRASLGVRRAIDPGRRTVVAEAEGFLPARESIQLAEGATGTINLVLERDPNYQPPKIASQPKRVIMVERPAARQRTPAYVAYGVSGAGLLLGGVSSILMLRVRGDLEKECHERHCPPTASNAAGDISKYHTYGTLSAVGLAVGLAGAGVGTYFLLSHKPQDEPPQDHALAARISAGYVDIEGRF